MLEGYVPILILFIIGVIVAIVSLVGSRLLGPSRPTRRKLMPYESGMEPIGAAQRRFNVKFSRTAMLFILFDIEVVFFFPYALVYRELAMPGLIVTGVFFLVLIVGFIYEWKQGALRWD